MIIGIPVVDNHELTDVMLEHLTKNAVRTDTKIIIIDNNSEHRYEMAGQRNGQHVYQLRYPDNKGYYYPLIDMYRLNPKEDYIGLIHNDVIIYEEGWDQRMFEAFEEDRQLGLIGLFGSTEIDQNGGRGAGSMCNFAERNIEINGQVYHGQSQDAGARIGDLRAACVLDSLFMLFRRDVIEQLQNENDPWEDLPLAHFYDRIWPCRTIEAGYRVAVIGVLYDHIGGMTSTGNLRYREDCIQWLEQRGIPYDNPETQMYLTPEERFLNEYREQKRFLPCIVGPDHAIRYLAR